MGLDSEVNDVGWMRASVMPLPWESFPRCAKALQHGLGSYHRQDGEGDANETSWWRSFVDLDFPPRYPDVSTTSNY